MGFLSNLSTFIEDHPWSCNVVKIKKIMFTAKTRNGKRDYSYSAKITSDKYQSTLVTTLEKLIQRTGLCFDGKSVKVQLFTKCANVCFILMNLTQAISILISNNEPHKLFECFSTLSFCVMGFLKYMSLQRYGSLWKFMFSQVTILEKEQMSYDGDNDVEYETDEEDIFVQRNTHTQIQQYTKHFQFLATILSRIYYFTLTIFVISPFFEFALSIWRDNKYGEYPHILPGWSPLDKIHFSGYLVTIIIEIIASVHCVNAHIAFDAASVGIMIFACGQYRSLRYDSQRVAGSGKFCNLSKRRDDRAKLRIIRCHRTHIALVIVITKLEKLLTGILGIYFILAVLTLCSVAVRLKSEVLGIMELMSLLQYMAASLTQLFLYCKYGDTVLNESTINMGEGPFAAAWWCLGTQTRRNLLLLSIGMSCPHHFSAGIFVVNLPAFVQIVRTAYSYYAVLR